MSDTKPPVAEIALAIKAYSQDEIAAGVASTSDVEIVTLSRMFAAGLSELLQAIHDIDKQGDLDGAFFENVMHTLSDAEAEQFRSLITCRDFREATP